MITVDKVWPKFIRELIESLENDLSFDFDTIAFQLFEWQSTINPIYKEYLSLIHNFHVPDRIEDIPHMPVSFFKNHKILSGYETAELIFRSSSTTNTGRSQHYVPHPTLYKKVSESIFKNEIGLLENVIILGLLPGYLERDDSSLIYMVNEFMKISGRQENGFYPNPGHELIDIIESTHELIYLFGVPYAFQTLFEFSSYRNWPHVILIETGGMKGKGKETTKNKLHQFLNEAFHPARIYSEYGMTELLSQAYTSKDQFFKPGYTMKLHTKEINDPFMPQKFEKSGVINVTDLANIFSCSFIETGDMGICYEDGNFEILGRLDNSEVRGCNLLI